MKVWVVVQHYDRGSDEVCVEGVFATEGAALTYIEEHFKGWTPSGDDMYDIGLQQERVEKMSDFPPGTIFDGMWFYADPDDESMSDRVMATEQEVK